MSKPYFYASILLLRDAVCALKEINFGKPPYSGSQYQRTLLLVDQRLDAIDGLLEDGQPTGPRDLRDRLAGQALVGLLASPKDVKGYDQSDIAGSLSARAYEYADAMLAARQKDGAS